MKCVFCRRNGSRIPATFLPSLAASCSLEIRCLEMILSRSPACPWVMLVPAPARPSFHAWQFFVISRQLFVVFPASQSMASSERLQNEILLKEEAFLKEQRAKLTEQLNKLKVRLLVLSWCSVFSRMENCTVEVFFGCCDGNRQKMCDLSSVTKHTTSNEKMFKWNEDKKRACWKS